MIRPIRRDVHWSLEEDALLRELAKSGESVANIATHLSRSAGAIRNRALRLNLALAKSQRRGEAK